MQGRRKWSRGLKILGVLEETGEKSLTGGLASGANHNAALDPSFTWTKILLATSPSL